MCGSIGETGVGPAVLRLTKSVKFRSITRSIQTQRPPAWVTLAFSHMG